MTCKVGSGAAAVIHIEHFLGAVPIRLFVFIGVIRNSGLGVITGGQVLDVLELDGATVGIGEGEGGS